MKQLKTMSTGIELKIRRFDSVWSFMNPTSTRSFNTSKRELSYSLRRKQLIRERSERKTTEK